MLAVGNAAGKLREECSDGAIGVANSATTYTSGTCSVPATALAAGAPIAAAPETAAPGATAGVCADANACVEAGGSTVAGYCTGPSAMQCCVGVGSSGSGNATADPTRVPLGDLATVVASYDTTAGLTSNSVSSYFHDLGWRCGHGLADAVRWWRAGACWLRPSYGNLGAFILRNADRDRGIQVRLFGKISAPPPNFLLHVCPACMLPIRSRVHDLAHGDWLRPRAPGTPASESASLGGNYGEPSPAYLGFSLEAQAAKGKTAASANAGSSTSSSSSSSSSSTTTSVSSPLSLRSVASFAATKFAATSASATATSCDAVADAPTDGPFENSLTALALAEAHRRLALHREVTNVF